MAGRPAQRSIDFSRDRAANILKVLARDHFDDGARYNAVALLDDAGQLDRAEIEGLLDSEHDTENRELLFELLVNPLVRSDPSTACGCSTTLLGLPDSAPLT